MALMPIRSMTGFAQVKGQVPESASPGPSGNDHLSFTLSLKSVNHRFLDLHFRLPSNTDTLEMKLRRVLKEKIARGHLEVTLNIERSGGEGPALNRQLVGAYVAAFRAAAAEFDLAAELDLNSILRMPGAMDAAAAPANGQLDDTVVASLDEAMRQLNQMREEEGRGIERELRQRMDYVRQAQQGVNRHRHAVLHAYAERLKARMQELIGTQADP